MCKELYVIEVDRDKAISKDVSGKAIYAVDGMPNVTLATSDLDMLHKVDDDAMYKLGLIEGQDEAWSIGRKLVCGSKDDGLDEQDMIRLFGTTNIIRIFRQFSPSDISRKLGQYAMVANA